MIEVLQLAAFVILAGMAGLLLAMAWLGAPLLRHRGTPALPPPVTLRDGFARRQAVVTLTDESGIRGVLLSTDHTGVLIAASAGQRVEYLPAGNDEWLTADGSLFVPAERIKFVQLLSPEGFA